MPWADVRPLFPDEPSLSDSSPAEGVSTPLPPYLLLLSPEARSSLHPQLQALKVKVILPKDSRLVCTPVLF